MAKILVGLRGCCGVASRKRGPKRPCAQKAIVHLLGRQYCYYHNPLAPKKFGQGYGQEPIK